MKLSISIIPLPVEKGIVAGDDLATELLASVKRQGLQLAAGDILVIKHKIVSKAEGRLVRLAQVQPSQAAKAWARQCGTDARVIELALQESRALLRKKMVAGRGVLITETRHGFVCANSGVDLSNVDGGEHALLLPKDPDASARRLRAAIRRRSGISVAVIISDSFGRPFREGLTEVAIGVAGMKPLLDFRGRRDPHGYVLRASAEAVGDELACAAGLVCGKLEGVPACILRGFRYQAGRGSGRELIRAKKNDLFR